MKDSYGSTTIEEKGERVRDRLDELLAQGDQESSSLSSSSVQAACLSSNTALPPRSMPQRGHHYQHHPPPPHHHHHHRRGLSFDQRPTSFRRRPSSARSGSGFASGQQQQQQQHRRRRTTSLSEFLLDVGQEAKTEWTTVSQTLVDEMNEYDQGYKTYNLDMALVRSLSVLPDDLMDFAHESVYLGKADEMEQDEYEMITEQEPLMVKPGIIQEEEEEEVAEEEEQKVSPGNVATGATMLVIAVLAVSSNGTALHLLHDVPAALKLYWRMTATTALLTLLLLKAAVWNKVHIIPHLTVPQWTAFVMAVVFFTSHSLLLYMALEHTTIGNAIIYANSQALLLIVGKFFVGDAVTCLEGTGVVLAFTGALLCSRDSEQSAGDDPEHSVTQARWGDFMALLSAVAGVLYLTLAKTIRSYVPVTLFMWMVMFLGSFLVLAYLAFTGVPISWDRHPYTGLFGWMVLQGHHVWILLHIAVIGNFLGTMGFVRAMAFFSTTTIAVATLMEPLLAQLIGYIFHVGLLPGPLGYLGNGLVMVGTVAVVWQSAEKADSGEH